MAVVIMAAALTPQAKTNTNVEEVFTAVGKAAPSLELHTVHYPRRLALTLPITLFALALLCTCLHVTSLSWVLACFLRWICSVCLLALSRDAWLAPCALYLHTSTSILRPPPTAKALVERFGERHTSATAEFAALTKAGAGQRAERKGPCGCG